MSTFTGRAAVADVLAQADARRVLDSLAPEFVDSPCARNLSNFPIEGVLQLVYGVNDPRVTRVLDHLGRVENATPRPAEAEPIKPRADYETEYVVRGSALVRTPARASLNRLAEIVLDGPSHGNPFVDVEISAWFRLRDREIIVGGIYDGEGRYLLRFLPPEVGEWSFETCSTARSLDGIRGQLDVAGSDAHGVVGVTDTYHFAHSDGTAYFPLGTTAYVWTHQDDTLQETTLRSLASAPFTKIRMCLFPKDFIYNRNEPERFVFPRQDDGWDATRFDLDYFRRLEQRIMQLDELGVQADLILFHPYDRWGFSRLGRAADDRYVTYVVRRLAAFPNIWWSIANEYDLLLDKDRDDWHRLGQLVRHIGWVRLSVRGLAAGTRIMIRHAEVLENEELATGPLRTARATCVDRHRQSRRPRCSSTCVIQPKGLLDGKGTRPALGATSMAPSSSKDAT
jgi:uncharacterized protein DUF5060/uncharacterized protein DUF4038/alpha-L-rhamnosidase-like protein